MTNEQFQQFQDRMETKIENGIAIGIEKHVNGKIRNLDKKIDDYIVADIHWKEKDKEWKAKAQPTVTLGTNVLTFGGGMKWVLGAVVTIAGSLFAFDKIKDVFK